MPALGGRADPPQGPASAPLSPPQSPPRFRRRSPTPLASNGLKQLPPKEGRCFRVAPGQKVVVATWTILALSLSFPSRFRPYCSHFRPGKHRLTRKQGSARAEPRFPFALAQLHPYFRPQQGPPLPSPPDSLRLRSTPEERGNRAPLPLTPAPFPWLLHPFRLQARLFQVEAKPPSPSEGRRRCGWPLSRALPTLARLDARLVRPGNPVVPFPLAGSAEAAR